MTMANPIRIRMLADKGDKRALTLLKILDAQGKMLTAILIGNNLVNISASSLSATLAMEFWGSVGVSISTGLLTFLVLIFGEITPKTRATYDPETLALKFAPFIYGLMTLLTPIIFLVDKVSGFLLRLLKTDTTGDARLLTEHELRTYVDVGHEQGAIEADEKKMINKVFDFSDSDVSEIMTPRIDLAQVDKAAGYEEMMELFRETKYSRLPVYEDKPDNMVGIVNFKDLVFSPEKEKVTAGDLLREAYFTYEKKKTNDLLEEMRKSGVNMAFILDEYGSCVGMVTLEDLLEEIVGDIRDEYDEDEKDLIRPVGKRRYLIEGSVKIDDVNEALELDLDSGDYDSIGGLLMGILDHLPVKGEGVSLPENGVELKAFRVNDNRVEKVILVKLPGKS